MSVCVFYSVLECLSAAIGAVLTVLDLFPATDETHAHTCISFHFLLSLVILLYCLTRFSSSPLSHLFTDLLCHNYFISPVKALPEIVLLTSKLYYSITYGYLLIIWLDTWLHF